RVYLLLSPAEEGNLKHDQSILHSPVCCLPAAFLAVLLGTWSLSAVEHRPADVVPQPLVVEYELANRLRELVALPPALEPPCAVAGQEAEPTRRGQERAPRTMPPKERGADDPNR